MPINVDELHNSRSSEGIPGDEDRSATCKFVATGSADQSAIVAAVYAAALASLTLDGDTVYKSGIRLNCISADANTSKGVWECTVTYRTAEWIANRADRITASYKAIKPEPPIERSSGSIGSQIVPMKYAIENVQFLHNYGSTVTEVEPKALNLHIDRATGKVLSVLGVDVTVPIQEEAVTKTYTAAQWQTQKPKAVVLAQSVNDSAWGGYQAGEVLYIGADYDDNHVYEEGSNSYSEKVVVTYRYVIKKNGVPRSGNSPAGTPWPTKDGHDVFQFYSKVKVSDTDTARHDIAMYQRIFPRNAFTDLPTP